MSKYILNTMYLKPKYEKNDYAPPGSDFAMRKIADDALIMVVKDDDTNTSELKIIERPTIEFYSVKDKENAQPYQELYISKDLVDTHTVEYSKREKEICGFLGIDSEYTRLRRAANKRYYDPNEAIMHRKEFRDFMNHQVYMNPYVYSVDENIEVFWKTKLMMENNWTSPPKQYNLSFYDIETLIGRFKTQVDQNNPEAPINVITYANTKKKHFYALCLRYEEAENDIRDIERDTETYIKEFEIDKDFEHLPGYKLHIKFFDSEIMLIKAFFQLIHEDKPDFALAWNNNYDNKYIIGRIKMYGLDPKDFFCHPDVPEEYRRFQFIEDPDRKDNSGFGNKKKKKGEFSRMMDWIIAPGYTTWLCQMSLYSNMRKRRIERSYRLDAIAEKEIKANKLDLHEFGLNMRNAPLKGYKHFLKYSIRDTSLLVRIEDKINDIGTYVGLTDNSDLRHGINESIVIRSAFLWTFLSNNCVIGNTVDYGVDENIEGALVQNWMLVDVDPVEVFGAKTRIFKNVVDFDAKSLYPSLMCQHQIGKENHRYRVMHIIDKYGKYIMSGERYNSMLQSLDVSAIDLGRELYGLPDLEEVVSDIEKKLKDIVS